MLLFYHATKKRLKTFRQLLVVKLEAVNKLFLAIYHASQATKPHAGVRIDGPFHGDSLVTSGILDQIIDFRNYQYASNHQHLINNGQYLIEKKMRIDERSFHFVAFAGDHIVGCVRLTPAPFELSSLHPEVKKLNHKYEYGGYLEISRLICASDRLPRSRVGERLLLSAGKWALVSNRRKGLFAITRGNNHRKFSKYGFCIQNDQPFSVATRAGAGYNIISATFRDITANVVKNLISVKTNNTPLISKRRI